MTSPSPVRSFSLGKNIGLIIGLVALVCAIVLAVVLPGFTSEPKNLPIGIAAPAAQLDAITGGITERAGEQISLVEVGDRDEAVALIEARELYGAIIIGENPEVLTASAASPVVAQILQGMQPALQGQLTQAVAAKAQAAGGTAPVVTVELTDVVPLVDADPRGTGLVSIAFPLILAGIIGGAATSFIVPGRMRRILTVIGYSAVAGIAITALGSGWLGILPGDPVMLASGIAATVLAISGTVLGFASLIGAPGIALGAALFMLIANPLSSAAAPVEFLAEPWGAIGQHLPVGAGAMLLREVSYFPNADVSSLWITLAAWAAGGLLLALVGRKLDKKTEAE